MEQYVIKGGNPLVGEVEIGGAKNAALAIISAAVMTDETVTIENLPNVRDINVLLNAISDIGAKVDRLDHLFIIWLWTMNISVRSEHPIICWEHSLENINMRR